MEYTLNYINRTGKEIIIGNLKTGDIVKVKSEKLPIIYHYGIVIKDDVEFSILHNDPDKINKSGGNIIKETLKDWIKNKEIVEVSSTNANKDEIYAIAENLKKLKYDLIHFNCEHFVNFVNKQKNVSPQVLNWLLVLSSITIAFFIVKKYKK